MNILQFLQLGAAFLALVHAILQQGHRPPINVAFLQVFAHFLQLVAIQQPLPTVYRRIVDLYGNGQYLGHDVYADWARHPFEFMRVTGLTPHEFEKLYDDIEPLMPGHGNLVDERNCLLMALWWLRMYPTLHQISLTFDVRASSAEYHLKHVIEILWNVLRTEIQWPTPAEWQSLRYSNMSDRRGLNHYN